MPFRLLLTTASLACLLSFSATAVEKAIDPSAPVTQGELPDLIRKVLLDKPDILMEAAKKYSDMQIAAEQERAKEGIKKNKAEIFDDADSPVVGNPKGDITLVEFFDYHCGYCKQLLPTMVQLVKDDPKIRVIFKEFPILSQDSVAAARAALAVHQIAPEKYMDYHSALMKTNGKYDEKRLLNIAEKQGINPEKLKKAMDDEKITRILDKNRELANELGVRGTPALLMGNKLFPGAISYEQIKNMVKDLRDGKEPQYDPRG